MGRKAYSSSTNVNAMTGKSVKYLNLEDSSNVLSGQRSVVYVYSESGTISKVNSLLLSAIKKGVSGSHNFILSTSASSYVNIANPYDEDIFFDYGEAFGNATVIPSSDHLRMIQSIVFDEVNPLTIQYVNNLDVTQNEKRVMNLTLEVEKISG